MSKVKETLALVHKEVEKAMGELSLVLERGGVSRGDLVRWSSVLEKAAVRLGELSKNG